MEAVPGQDMTGFDNQKRKSYSLKDQQRMSELSFDSETQLIDDTIESVKDKVWSFRAALKAAAEALVHYGLSPAVVGYSSVPVGPEDEQLAQKNEAEAALQKVKDDEMESKSAHTERFKESRPGHGTKEWSSLVRHQEDEDDSNHAYIEGSRKAKDEQKALKITWQENDDED